MSYFDHVRCHACRASLDPEEIGPQGMACPKCGVQLSLTDLFGVKASFAEDDLPDLGLDDLMGKVAQPGADYRPPPAPPKRPRVAPEQAPRPAATSSGKGPIRPTVVRAAPTPQPVVASPAPSTSEAPRVRSIGLSSPGTPPPRPQPAAKASDAALVATGAASPPAEAASAPPPAHRRIPGQSSAADVMRALKKKR